MNVNTSINRSRRLRGRAGALCAVTVLGMGVSAVWAAPTGAEGHQGKAVIEQDDSKKQTLVIGYPNSGIVIKGTGSDATRYRGLIYVKVFPISPDLVRKYGAGPIVTAELSASQRTVAQLPLGEYEVRYGMRTGSELKTFIVRNVILRADRGMTLTVEMNDEASATIIGGDMTAQQMADTIRALQQEIAALRKEMATLKQK